VYERVLLPLDGSDGAEAILPFVEKIAGPSGAEVVLLQVVEPITAAAALAAADPLGSDLLPRRQVAAGRYLATVADRLRGQGLRVRTLISLGDPAAEIVLAAREQKADLVAMATHARGAVGRAIFGSVAEDVLRVAPVPVLVIRMAAARPAAAGGPVPLTIEPREGA
jgi:nucleotide-binding universal stress UspA family protein